MYNIQASQQTCFDHCSYILICFPFALVPELFINVFDMKTRTVLANPIYNLLKLRLVMCKKFYFVEIVLRSVYRMLKMLNNQIDEMYLLKKYLDIQL